MNMDNAHQTRQDVIPSFYIWPEPHLIQLEVKQLQKRKKKEEVPVEERNL